MTAPEGLSVRPMQMEDVDWVSECESSVCQFPWSRTNFSDALAAGYSGLILLSESLQAGYAIVMQVLDEAHLLTFGVAPSMQRRGFGAWMLTALLHRASAGGASQMFLEVRPSNTNALSLYRKAGFEVIGRRKGYYPAVGGREDALVLRRQL